MRIHLLLPIALLLSITSYGQTTLSGKVVAENTPLSFIVVKLQAIGDTLIRTSSLTNERGEFELLNVPPGIYTISIKEPFYKPYISTPITLQDTPISLENITLFSETKDLNEVSLVARKKLLTISAEKTVLNVSNFTNLTGLSALEVLRRTPGVILDKDNNISLKGKSGVRIFMDGRPTQLQGDDLIQLLKGMLASDIESIEVISTPSAKYDAAGTAGIINIVLKKNKGFGNNASIDLGLVYSKTMKYNGTVSFNHRDKRLSVFGNYSINAGNWENYMSLYRKQNGYTFDQQAIENKNSTNQNTKIGVDYTINKKNVIGINAIGNFSKGEWTSDSRTPITIDSLEKITQVLVATNIQPSTSTNLNFNLNYRYSDTLGTKFSTDADYGYYGNRQNSFQPNYYKSPDETIIQQVKIYKNNAPTTIQIFTLKSDYERKIYDINCSAGYKISSVETQNTFDFYNVENNIDIKDPTRSNTFNYTEKVNAVYINANRKIKKVSIQLGFRYEYTHSVGTLTSQLSTPEPVDRTYGNLFPSAAITYALNTKNTLNLTYSKRIDRPDYQSLNPFENKLDELTYQKGNAFLKPQYAHAFELSHVFMEFLTTSIGYTRTNDFISEIIDTLNGKASYLTLTNLDYVNNYSFNIGLPIAIKKWYMGYINFNLFHNDYHANSFNGKQISLNNTAYTIYINNSFTLKKGWSIDLSGWYNSPTIMISTFLSNRMYSIDIGIKKKLWKGNGDIKLNFSDIFRGQIWSGVNNFGGYSMNASGGYESTQVRLNLSYRIGNSVLKNEQRKIGLEDEKNRIK